MQALLSLERWLINKGEFLARLVCCPGRWSWWVTVLYTSIHSFCLGGQQMFQQGHWCTRHNRHVSKIKDVLNELRHLPGVLDILLRKCLRRIHSLTEKERELKKKKETWWGKMFMLKVYASSHILNRVNRCGDIMKWELGKIYTSWTFTMWIVLRTYKQLIHILFVYSMYTNTYYMHS